MPIFDNEFTCSNGHKFRANAKVRARCPNCGLMTRMDFSVPKLEPKQDEPKNEPKTTEPKKPVLVRQGRPREMPKAPEKPMPTKTHAKPKKPITKSVVSKSSTKRVAKAVVGKTQSGLIKTRRITSNGVSPVIRRPPKRTAVARHIQSASSESFMDSVVRRFGPGR